MSAYIACAACSLLPCRQFDFLSFGTLCGRLEIFIRLVLGRRTLFFNSFRDDSRHALLYLFSWPFLSCKFNFLLRLSTRLGKELCEYGSFLLADAFDTNLVILALTLGELRSLTSWGGWEATLLRSLLLPSSEPSVVPTLFLKRWAKVSWARLGVKPRRDTPSLSPERSLDCRATQKDPWSLILARLFAPSLVAAKARTQLSFSSF